MHNYIIGSEYISTYRRPVCNVYETVTATTDDPQSGQETKHTLQARSNQTARKDQHAGRHSGTCTPPIPPRAYSVSSSLDKIDNFENLKLQDLGNHSIQSQMTNKNPKVDNENTYQPLIPPWRSNNNTTAASEYQSLTQLQQQGY